MGSKIEAAASLPQRACRSIPGYDDSQDPGDLASRCRTDRLPGAGEGGAGGGGKGIRIAHDAGAFRTRSTRRSPRPSVASATRE